MRTRPKHTLESFTVGRACRECNHGWMNDLEDWFESRLGYLIEPKWPKLALTMIEELKPERNKLAHWMMKTAVTFSLSTMESEYRVVFPADVTLKIKEGILPKNVWVDLAYSDLATVGGAITRGFRIINAGKYTPNLPLNNGDGFKFIAQFNHLLLRIGQAPAANVSYESWRGESPIRIYPTPVPTIPDDFAYQDIMKFEHSVILKTWMDCQGNII